MNRRSFLFGGLTALGSANIGWTQSKPVPRIGYLASGNRSDLQLVEPFRQGLREHGYLEGENIRIEYRYAESQVERFPTLAKELAEEKVDLILAVNSLAARAAKQATTTIPIVVPVMGDPVGDGLVSSLSRPGGNVTGLTFLGPELLPKRLAILKEALPSAARIAAIWHPDGYGERTMVSMVAEVETAARALAMELQLFPAHRPEYLDATFSAIATTKPDALLVFPSPMLFTERAKVVQLATRYRLPSMAMAREYAELGRLLAYGASLDDLRRRSAKFVDRILSGAKPSDLPVEQPTKFELAVNLKTARAFSLIMPPSILARADEVIE